MSRFSPKPEWLKVRAPGGDTFHRLTQTFRRLDLHTVCEEAHCPNVGECWRHGTATIMLLGETCTRGCRFCAVATGNPRGVVDVREPEHVARAISVLGLTYVVLTMVNRDDLLDGGADPVARTVRRLHDLRPDLLVEALVGDFQGHLDDVDTVLDARPDVFAHNVETVRRLTRTVRDARSSYDQSLVVLRHAKGVGHEGLLTKSSVMVGLGETDEEVLETLGALREAGVDIVTIGQYLRPTPKHHDVVRFVEPAIFDTYAAAARSMGFLYAASGPLVRSSYRAAEVFLRSMFEKRGETTNTPDGEWVEAALASRMEVAREGADRVARELKEAGGDEGEAGVQGVDTAAHEAPAFSPVPLVPPSALVRRA